MWTGSDGKQELSARPTMVERRGAHSLPAETVEGDMVEDLMLRMHRESRE